MPFFSCITTVYDDGPVVLNCVASICNQSFDDFEYIIVDDGSGPETRALLEGLADPRIKVIHQANDGLSGARNKALEQARGDYVCFLDADDSRPHWALDSIARVAARDAPDLLLCRGALHEIRDEPLPFYDGPAFDAISALCPSGTIARGEAGAERVWRAAQLIEPQSANKVVRRDLLEDGGVGFPNTHFFEDIFFHTNVIARAERLSFVNTPCFAYFRRYGRPQITSGSGERRFDIIAVTKMTLESFSRRPQFHEPAHRNAVLCSCMKILQWCGDCISHVHRSNFQQATLAMLRMADPLYLHFDRPALLELEVPESLCDYMMELRDAV